MSDIDFRFLRAAVALMDELNTSRAAVRLGIGQSAMSKQLSALHEYLGYPLFMKQGRTMVPTAAGDAFVAQARIALDYAERAKRMSRAAHQHMEVILHIGKSPYTDPYLITNVLSLRLPYYPTLQVEVTSKLAAELSHDLLNGTLDLAFLTGMPDTARITSVVVARQPFFVAMLEADDLTLLKQINKFNLQERSCILFERSVHPFLYDRFITTVQPAKRPGALLHHVTTAEEASQSVTRGLGVAILTQAGAWRIARDGITIRPLNTEGLVLETRLACRADNEERLVSDFVRTFVRQLSPPIANQGNNILD